MEAFATIEELESRWRSLKDTEKDRAETLLLDASVKIVSMCKQHGVTIDEEDEVQAHSLVSISCEMVKRAMLASVDMAPTTNYSQAAGGYSESFTYANPTGDLYLTSAEKRELGISRQRMFSVKPSGGVLGD